MLLHDYAAIRKLTVNRNVTGGMKRQDDNAGKTGALPRKSKACGRLVGEWVL
jgi:hypothetical protein